MKNLQKFFLSNGLFLKLFFLFEIIYSIPSVSFGQSKIDRLADNHSKTDSLFDDWSVGLKLGSNYFSGDLSSSHSFFPLINVDGRDGTTIGAFVSKRISKTFTATLDSDFSNLYDTGDNYNNEYFKSTIFQLNLIVDADMFYIFSKTSSRFKIRPYAGIGIIFYHSTAFDQKSNQLLRDTSYDSMIGISSLNTKKIAAFNIPIGLKVTQKLGNAMEIGADFRINNTLTDKLDATIGDDTSSINKGGLSLDLIPKNSWYDAWGYLGISLSYKLPSRNKNSIKN